MVFSCGLHVTPDRPGPYFLIAARLCRLLPLLRALQLGPDRISRNRNAATMTTLAAVAPRLMDIRCEGTTSIADEIHIFFRFVDGRVSLSLLLLLVALPLQKWNTNQCTVMAQGSASIHMLCLCAAVKSK